VHLAGRKSPGKRRENKRLSAGLAASQRFFRQVQNLTQGIVRGRLEKAADGSGVSPMKTL
jgi:hypothetical protein